MPYPGWHRRSYSSKGTVLLQGQRAGQDGRETTELLYEVVEAWSLVR